MAEKPDFKSFELNPNPRAVLLTGATGFLGAFLLRQLLDLTEAKVYCLVRAATFWEAEERLIRNLKHFKCWDEKDAPRIQPVVGDLSRPLLNLSERDFKRLAAKVDALYHNGAFVNFIHPYARLRAANVQGTQEMVRLAVTEKVKPLHYTSTLRIFGNWAGEGGVVRETDRAQQSQVISSGYSQSKWVAERMVHNAGEGGVPFTVFRPGMVTGDTVNGMANFDDIVGRMIKGCIQMGQAPEKDMLLDFTPADWATRAMVKLTLDPRALGGTYHLVTPHPISWNEVVEHVRALGYSLERVAYGPWLEDLKKAAQTGTPESNALIPLLSYFAEEMPDEVANRRFDCSALLGLLDGEDAECPRVDLPLLKTYFQAYITEGFLEPPPVGELARRSLVGVA